jgi:hypothetical protein
MITNRCVVVALLLVFAGSLAQADIKTRVRRGKCSITGNTATDHINVTLGFGMLVISDGSEQPQVLDASTITEISITTRGGDDIVNVAAGVLPSSGDLISLEDFEPTLPIDIDINTGGGNDQITVAGDWRDVRVSSGLGDDRVSLSAITVTGQTFVRTGGGADTVIVGLHGTESDIEPEEYIASAYFFGDVNIGLGGGADRFIVLSAEFGTLADDDDPAPAAMSNVTINGNAGQDCFLLCRVNIDLEDSLTGFEFECEPQEEPFAG